METMKICTKFHIEKPLKEFPWNTGKTRYFSTCYQCRRENYKGNENTKSRIRNRNLLKSYGITLVDYNKLFNQQEGKCAICGTHQINLIQGMNVDHDHETGLVRALLCPDCNRGLGCFKDNIELIKKAGKYLKLWK